MAYDATRHQTVLFAGNASGQPLNDTWAWNGELWTQSEDIGPSARTGPALAFDSIRERVVLFGGLAGDGSTFFADTWEWDGTEWTQMADTGPSGRQGHAIAFDSKIKRVVLFGGGIVGDSLGRNQPFGDTWSWDGTEWTQEDETGPSARSFHRLAYDAVRDRVVLFGGDSSSSILGDTWEWDGSRWRQVADTGPSRAGYGMGFDGSRVLLFGGLGPTGAYFGDTWSWDGKHWTQLQDIGPAPRVSAGMVYDNDRSRSVLFRGYGQNNAYLRDTWELYEHS